VILPDRVWVAIEPVDMRIGADGLALRVQETLQRIPCNGNAYAFRNRRSTRIKLLIWDGNGVWLCHRRLHHGSFIWPVEGDTEYVLTAAQWQWLVNGVDWRRIDATPPAEMRV